MNISKKTLAVALLFSSYAVANTQDCLAKLVKAQQEIASKNADVAVTQNQLAALFAAAVACLQQAEQPTISVPATVTVTTTEANITDVTLGAAGAALAVIKRNDDVKEAVAQELAAAGPRNAEKPATDVTLTPAVEPAKAA